MDKAKNLLLMRGNAGRQVAALKQVLRKAMGMDAAAYPGLSAGDEFDADTETALRPGSCRLPAGGLSGREPGQTGQGLGQE